MDSLFFLFNFVAYNTYITKRCIFVSRFEGGRGSVAPEQLHSQEPGRGAPQERD